MPVNSKTDSSLAHYRVVHETHYQYVVPVSLSQQLLYLRPRTFQLQQCHSYTLRIDPTPGEQHEAPDFFGNHRQYLAITEPHEQLTVYCESVLTLRARPGQELLANSVPWEQVRDTLRRVGDPTRLEPIKYLFESPHVALIDSVHDYALQCFTPGRSVLAAAFELTLKINREFAFDPEATDISTPLSELISLRRGVCQDFAHLMIGCLRSVGIPCRYVSGYILTTPPAGKPRLVGADASHAWVSVYCPSIGWVDFDPTNRCMVNLEHITLGWGRDFSDVSLLRGVLLGGGAQTLKVSVTVTPQSEPDLPAAQINSGTAQAQST